jgi:hypothetical protein
MAPDIAREAREPLPQGERGSEYDALPPIIRCYACLAGALPSAACAAASRAIGTRNGEHET